MRTSRALLVTVYAGLLTSPLSALSIVAAKPHDPRYACGAINRVLKNIWDKKFDVFPMFYTDKLGQVEWEERDQFNATFTSSEGKRDDRKPRISRLYKLTDHKFGPLYLVNIVRSAWHEHSYEDDGMGGETAIKDPRFYPEASYWLVDFRSESVHRFREGFEFYQLGTEKNRMPDCKDDDLQTSRLDPIDISVIEPATPAKREAMPKKAKRKKK